MSESYINGILVKLNQRKAVGCEGLCNNYQEGGGPKTRGGALS